MASHPTSHSADVTPLVAHTRTPEPLSAQEDALLRRILAAASFHGAPQLLDQVRGIQLVPAISDAEHRIYIQHPDMPRSTFSPEGRARIPNTVLIRTPDGHIAAQIDIWVERGHLRAMHIRWAGARVPMTLPNPEWVVVTPAIVPAPAATARPVAVETATPSVRPALPALPVAMPSTRTVGRVLVALLVLALSAAIIAGAYALGRSGEADVDAARAAGTQQGQREGAADGQVLGSFRGATEGEIAGRQSTYDAAVVKAQAAAVARAKAAAAAKAEAARVAAAAAAAAAAAPRYVSNTNCSGYRDSRGYWICS